MKRGNIWVATLTLGIVVAIGSFASAAHADAAAASFNLVVTPSPIVTTVKPGEKTIQDLKIYNQAAGAEALKIQPRSFTFNSKNGHVNLGDSEPPGIASWISFSAPTFTVGPGQSFDEKIIINVPKDAGFSYSFALVISPQSVPKAAGGTRQISGSLAIFTLINVDRPGAKVNLEAASFSSTKRLYQYLPATFNVRFKNTGNTIVQPFGNLFIQRGSNTKTSLAVLNVNSKQGYILPGTERTVTASWNDGFPAYKTITNSDGTTSEKLVWNWANLSKLRIGRYTARLVAVYDNNGTDVPIVGSVSFWVIPWKILLVVLAVVLLLLFSLFMLVRSIVRSIKRRFTKKDKKSDKAETAKESDEPKQVEEPEKIAKTEKSASKKKPKQPSK